MARVGQHCPWNTANTRLRAQESQRLINEKEAAERVARSADAERERARLRAEVEAEFLRRAEVEEIRQKATSDMRRKENLEEKEKRKKRLRRKRYSGGGPEKRRKSRNWQYRHSDTESGRAHSLHCAWQRLLTCFLF